MTPDMIDDKSIKRTIRRIREERGLSQEAFAQELGMDSSTLWRLEEGRTHIISPHVYRIAEFAGMKVEDLIMGKDVAGTLEEARDSREKIEALKAFYEKELENRDDIIRNLNKYIKTFQK